MNEDFRHQVFNYARSPDQDEDGGGDRCSPARHPVVVVGAGPVGLSAAIDLAQQGIPVVLLDDQDRLSTGSRAICFAKRTLEIFDRLQCGDPIADKGVNWNVGKVFFRDAPVYSFNLLAESGHRRPAFVNLQQYYAEGFLCERARQLPCLDMRWKNRVVGLSQLADCVELTIDTPDGEYRLRADYVVVADGSRSPTRSLMGLESKGRVFKDRFLIADVKMKADFPSERWFWFDPPFHPNQSVLLHRQPDNVWRIDFQLGWEADPAIEKLPENVIPRVQALLGKEVEFDLEWVSVYTFSCLRMEKFRHGRVLFAGDAAHTVSPFGARGANSGVQDADNMAWKLALVLRGHAPDALLDSYAAEREFAADENILNSTRSTDFITPKSAISKIFRDAVLELSKEHPFARRLVNSGRLSTPSTYGQSVLNTADIDRFEGAMAPGAPLTDAPVTADGKADWLLAHTGNRFCGIYFSLDGALTEETLSALHALRQESLPVMPLIVVSSGVAADDTGGFVVLEDTEGCMAKRFDARPGTFYLLRPDQHVCARWRDLDPEKVTQAVARATLNSMEFA